MQEIRCGQCNKKLADAVFTRLNIKCPRCGTFNQLSATSAVQERPPSVEPTTQGYGRTPALPISTD